MQNYTQLRRRRRGLTLLELVMVVSILAILTALVVPGMSDQQESTRRTVAQSTLQDLRDTIANRYMQDMTDPLFQGLPRPNVLNTARVPTSSTLVTPPSGTVPYLPQLHFLFANPRQYDAATTTAAPYAAINDFDTSSRLGWNGPYLMSKTATYPDPTAFRFPKDPVNGSKTWADYGFTADHGLVGDYTVLDPWGSPIVMTVLTSTHGASTMYTAYLVSAGYNRSLDISTWTLGTNGALNTGDDVALAIKSWK